MRPLDTFASENPRESEAMVRSNLLCEEGRKLRDEGNFDEALVLFQQDLLLCEDVYGSEHSYVANSHFDIASCYYGLEDYAEAAFSYQRALAIHEKTCDPDSRCICRDLNGLARCYSKLKNYQESILLFQRVLQIEENRCAPDIETIVAQLDWIAFGNEKLSHWDQALPLRKQALKICEDTFGVEDAKTLECITYLARAYGDINQWDQVLPLLLRAFNIWIKVENYSYDAENPETARSQKILNISNGKIGEHTLFQRALAILERFPVAIAELDVLGAKLRLLGQDEQALALYQRTLAICEKVHGPEHADTVVCLNKLACFYESFTQWNQALPLRKRVLDICENTYGPEHPETLNSIELLACVYEKLEQFESALPLRQRALQIAEKESGVPHADVAVRILSLARVHTRLEQYEMVLPLLQRVFEIKCKDGFTADELFELGSAFEMLKNNEQANDLYARAHIRALDECIVDAELAESFGEFNEALSVCMKTWTRRDRFELPKNINPSVTLVDFATVLQRLCQHEDAGATLETADALHRLGAELLRLGNTKQANELMSIGSAIQNKQQKV